MSGSRALQKVLKVAYLGPEYSFSHLAAVERFGQAVEFMRVGSIAAVFEEVNRGHVDFGVVPLENSTDGRVADTLDMFMRLPQLQDLRGGSAARSTTTCWPTASRRRSAASTASRRRCRSAATGSARTCRTPSLHEVASTAVAAELAQREPGAAAVASRQAAVRYGLRILFADIEDSPHNETRFAVIGHAGSGPHRQRQDGHHVPDPAQPGLARRGPGHLQAEQAQPDLDRVVPRQARPSRSTSSSWTSKATSTTPR